jgi:hypothetical protein
MNEMTEQLPDEHEECYTNVMKVNLLLAESGVVHPDGTFSVLRGGINKVAAPKPPVPLMGVLAIRFEIEPAEGGANHAFEISAMDEDGKEIAPRLSGQFNAPKGGGFSNLLLSFQMLFPRFGRFVFNVTVDKILRESWAVTAVEQPEKKREA